MRKPFADRLTEHINRYVALRRALGYAFDTQAATLRAFGHFVQRRRAHGPLTQRLVRAARQISPHFPMRGHTLYTVIGLLASTGLRSGEVVRLDRQDVDLEQG